MEVNNESPIREIHDGKLFTYKNKQCKTYFMI